MSEYVALEQETAQVLAGGVWPWGDPERIAFGPISALAFADNCAEVATRVLAAAGYTLAELTGAIDRSRINPGEKEDVALALLMISKSCRGELLILADGKLPNAAFKATKALRFIELERLTGRYLTMGYLRAMLDSMDALALTDMVHIARRASAGQDARTQKAAEKASEKRMERWGKRAIAAAKEFRSTRPESTIAEALRHVRKKVAGVPLKDERVVSFLRQNGVDLPPRLRTPPSSA